VKKSLTICLPVLTECTNVTDRQTHTDRQTDRHRMTAKAALDASIARQKLTTSCDQNTMYKPGFESSIVDNVRANTALISTDSDKDAVTCIHYYVMTTVKTTNRFRHIHRLLIITARRLCIARTMLWQDASVRLSVCWPHASFLSKRLNISSDFFTIE